MKKIRLVLAGTASFSKKIFESLILDNRFEIIALISQPNKSLNRNKEIISTPVSALAKTYNIKLFQPNKVREIYDELAALNFDFFMTAAFGQLIPSNVLALPKVLSLNVHGSILEKYRGAAPIQAALLNNDKVTGISLIEMVDKMDAGDILKEFSIDINEDDTALELFDKLGSKTADVIGDWLVDIYNGNYQRRVQNEELVTFAKKIKNEDAELNLDLSMQEAINKIRAFNDNPGAFLIYNNKRLKIFRVTNKKNKSPLKIKFADGFLYLIEYQFEGKKKIKYEV